MMAVRFCQPDFPEFVVVHAKRPGDVEELVTERDLGGVEGVLHILGQFRTEGRGEVEAMVRVVVALVEVGHKGRVFDRPAKDREPLCLMVEQGMGDRFADVLRLEDDSLAGLTPEWVGRSGRHGRADHDHIRLDPTGGFLD